MNKLYLNKCSIMSNYFKPFVTCEIKQNEVTNENELYIIHANEHFIKLAGFTDINVDNRKFKDYFGFKAKMLSPDDTEKFTGHVIGGVCPFALSENVKVYLDESMKRFETMFPACGSGNSAIELTISELEETSKCNTWIDVCKGW